MEFSSRWAWASEEASVAKEAAHPENLPFHKHHMLVQLEQQQLGGGGGGQPNP